MQKTPNYFVFIINKNKNSKNNGYFGLPDSLNTWRYPFFLLKLGVNIKKYNAVLRILIGGTKSEKNLPTKKETKKQSARFQS